MANIYENAEALIGKTPLIRFRKTEREFSLQARLLVKWEAKNPGGSAKDRVALSMIEDAERRGVLSPGGTVIEPTSGNTGIGLCLIGAIRGYRVVIVMPDTMSRERILLMKAYGAEVVLTPGAGGMAAAIAKAEELQRTIPGSFIPGQFDNPENAAAHERTTGPEIWADTDGDVDVFVAGIGTGGTLTGTARYLKAQKPGIVVIGVEPAGSPLLTKGTAGAHGIQGIGANFVPKVLDTSLPDEVADVTDEDAFAFARWAARAEGVLCGISGGAALAAAIAAAKRPEMAGKTVVVLLPDGGERYLSSGLYD